MTRAQRINKLGLIIDDCRTDATSLDGKPATGAVIGEVFGSVFAAVSAVAEVLREEMQARMMEDA